MAPVDKTQDLGHNIKAHVSIAGGNAEVDVSYSGKYGTLKLEGDVPVVAGLEAIKAILPATSAGAIEAKIIDIVEGAVAKLA